jgi:hypothetical protein
LLMSIAGHVYDDQDVNRSTLAAMNR